MIVFKNPGLIDESAITTMGVNAKEGDNPIGVFGTGLKYAISVILRTGGNITIYRGTKRYEFKLKPKLIRGKEFNIVTMNGKELGWTDHLGVNWSVWQAYRELWSNSRDEGGSVFACYDMDSEAAKLAAPSRSTTIIQVTGKEFERAHETRSEIILQTQPDIVGSGVDVHFGRSQHVFYKGIRVYTFPDGKESLYTYNLTGTQRLTEDRTLLYPHIIAPTLAQAILQCTSTPYLSEVLNTDVVRDSYESTLNYSGQEHTRPSTAFMSVAEDLHTNKKLVMSAARMFNHYKDTMPGYVSPYLVELSQIEKHVFDEAMTLVMAKVSSPGFAGIQIMFKSKINMGKVTATKRVITIEHSVVAQGKLALARALLIGLSYVQSGSSSEQLANYMLTGQWIPEELTSRAPDYDDSIPF